MDWSQPKAEDLGWLLMLDPQVHELLSKEELSWVSKDHEDDHDQPGTLELSLDDSNWWVQWHSCCVETPVWWPELWRVPNQKDIPQFTGWV